MSVEVFIKLWYIGNVSGTFFFFLNQNLILWSTDIISDIFLFSRVMLRKPHLSCIKNAYIRRKRLSGCTLVFWRIYFSPTEVHTSRHMGEIKYLNWKSDHHSNELRITFGYLYELGNCIYLTVISPLTSFWVVFWCISRSMRENW